MVRGALASCLGVGLVALTLGASDARAEEWRVIGSRFHGMGGAGVAVAEGAAAAYWNPGALGFSPPLLEVDVPLGLSAAAEGDLLPNTRDVLHFIERSGFEATFDKIEAGQQLTPEELSETLALVARELPGFADNGQGGVVTLDGGFMIRRGRWVLTSRASGLAGIDPVLDARGVAFGSELDVDLNRLVGPGADHSSEFTNPASQSLADAIASSAAGLTQAQAEEIVFRAEQAGIDTSNPGVRELVSQVTTSSLGGGLNQTGAVVRGLYTKEVGLASGIVLGDRLGVGVHVRHVHGTTVDTSILLAGSDRSIGTEDRRRSTAIALDMGLLYEVQEGLRLGLAARNVNRPTFKTRGPHPFELKPQVRLGAALEVTSRLRVAADLDLTQNAFETIDGFESRMLAIGLEYRSRFLGHSVDLRAGVHRNTASGPNSDIAVTLGFGLYAGNFQLDLSLGSALERRRFDAIDTHVPHRLDVATSIRWVTEF